MSSKNIINSYLQSVNQKNKYKIINTLNTQEKQNYKQLKNKEKFITFRNELINLLDSDNKEFFFKKFEEWSTYGVSINTVNMEVYSRFKEYYDEMMLKYSIKKDLYHKLDFAAQEIKPLILDQRCLLAKLSPMQIFKASYHLGEPAAVANFRLMYNPANIKNIKFREWIYHFDNSNYDSEFKLITTRIANTIKPNNEQCLGLFPYDTNKVIRYTQNEYETKILTMNDLISNFSNICEASYAIIKDYENNNIPFETGLRTEMIMHHRSANNIKNNDARDSELMTFHSIDRCKPFLEREILLDSNNISNLQSYVLGGFVDNNKELFMKYFIEEKDVLNEQFRHFRSKKKIKSINSFKIAEIKNNTINFINKKDFIKQQEVYDNLPLISSIIPKLNLRDNPKKTILDTIPILINYDQNVELKPDCSENLIFPARTHIREREQISLLKNIQVDLDHIYFDKKNNLLLKLESLVSITRLISDIYLNLANEINISIDKKDLFNSKYALSSDYSFQLTERTYSHYAHLTIILFIYYLIDDLEEIDDQMSHNDDLNKKIILVKNEKIKVLQHFVTYKAICDSN